MKSIKYITIFLILSLFTSCSKDYLETFPTDGLDVNLVFTSTENAWGALNGIHRHMYTNWGGDQWYGGQGSIMQCLDVMGEDVILPNRANGYFVKQLQWLDHTDQTGHYTKFVWYFYYKVISNANNIIGYIDDAEGTQKEKDVIKGQALAYRAWAHWMLVQLYGKRYENGGDNSSPGVPIMTFESPEAKARGTVEAVYELINNDLDDAIEYLQGYARLNKSHLDQSVVKGLKARVLLTQQKWEEAADMAVSASQGYSLMIAADQFTGYNDYSNSEWMWGSKVTGDQTQTYGSFFAYMGANYFSRGVKGAPRVINVLLYNSLSNTDIRKGRFWIPNPTLGSVVIPEGGSIFPYMHQKFMSEAESSSNGCITYMRVAEMYLIAAEGYARSNQTAKARQALYDLMITRDPAYTKSTQDGQGLVNEILTSRRIELWGEGFRFTDLKRLNERLNRSGTNHEPSVTGSVVTVEPGDRRWQWMIPKTSEIDVNPEIEQNPA